MAVVERLVSRLVLGACAPVVLMLAGWWGSLAVLGESPWISWAALAGLVSGVALDLTVLRPRLGGLYRLSAPALAAIALFYSVMIYGFFMGLPVANLLVGAAWGFALGRRYAADGAGTAAARAEVRVAARSAAVMMGAFCCATAWLALTEPTIASQVRGMVGLSFTPSMGSLRALALFGGIALVVAAYAVTVVVARLAGRAAHSAA